MSTDIVKKNYFFEKEEFERINEVYEVVDDDPNINSVISVDKNVKLLKYDRKEGKITNYIDSIERKKLNENLKVQKNYFFLHAYDEFLVTKSHFEIRVHQRIKHWLNKLTEFNKIEVVFYKHDTGNCTAFKLFDEAIKEKTIKEFIKKIDLMFLIHNDVNREETRKKYIESCFDESEENNELLKKMRDNYV